ncbi:hypothetical protein [Streptomyces mirabilis]
MAESAEHTFLSETALNIMEESANSQLFGCRESGRKKFDFSCDLTKNWTRAVSGQTLWRHDRDGIDKDLRTLLTDDEAAAAVYVARDAVATRGRVEEIIRDYRRSPLRESLSKLRIFWIPADFDADDEKARTVVRAGLRNDVYRDLLMRVALGGITSQDVRNFAISGRLGLPVWLLVQLGRDEYLDNYTRASKRYGIGIPSLKEEILRLELIGILSREESKYYGLIQVTEKGRAMLDICARLHNYLSGKREEGEEFLYICKLLGIDFTTLHPDGQVNFSFYEDNKDGIPFGHSADNTALMLSCLYYASQNGPLEWNDRHFALPDR